ncbi:hypothetical protein CLOSTASPAR_06665 [[Clostridium] asparagiforme DSM 15981]|nr:hypothetical protein CLOSTASPAR_06665 [[Clostridium] asparagiforme DSM 15981]
MAHILAVRHSGQEADRMALPEKMTRSLLRATSDKTDLNKKVLRLHRSFKEVDKIINGKVKKSDKK